MPLTPQPNDYLLCPICFNSFSTNRRPYTLICSHTCCSSCLKSLHCCPFDQTLINNKLPENEAILGLISSSATSTTTTTSQYSVIDNYLCSYDIEGLDDEDVQYYRKCVESIKEMALLLKPNQQSISLSRPMQRKLISLLHCQIVDPEGRLRAIRNARAIGERALAELLIKHQDSHQLSSNLWAAVRSRGCQFLGPAMQEEVLRLVLLALEDGSALSRKVLVMFVVQRLSPHFPHQASKTAIGHVIQLLYRASCFKLTKRDGDSSLMQLKEEYCSYETLRREHDTQIVSIALEAGLRISPDQWSSLLYGDSAHKSHMQSIIDKLQSPASFSQSIQEFIIALQRTGDPSDLATIRLSLEKLALIDPTPISESACYPTHQELSEALESSKIITLKLTEYLQTFRSSHSTPIGSSNNIRSNRYSSNITSIPNPKQRIGRVKPLMHKTCTPQENGEHFSKLNVLSSPRSPVRQIVRPCASVQPSRIISPSNSTVSLSLTVGSHSILTSASNLSGNEATNYGNSKQIHTISVPMIVTTTTTSSAVFQSGSMSAPIVKTTTSCTPTLPSEDDQFIPFDDQPFVSKYGPISRIMNLINTPTMAAPGNGMSQQMSQNGINNGAHGTHPTNVILGRSAVPSLTLIQPLQILTTTAFIADPSSTQQYGRTAFIAESPHFQNFHVSGDTQSNGSSLT